MKLPGMQQPQESKGQLRRGQAQRFRNPLARRDDEMGSGQLSFVRGPCSGSCAHCCVRFMVPKLCAANVAVRYERRPT